MRLVVSDFMSLDGVAQAPGGQEEDTDGGFAHGGWSMPFFDPEVMGAAVGEALERTDALLFGRRTWQVMAGAWPERAGDPFADRMNAMKKYVLSTTLSEDDLVWTNSSLVPADDVVGALRRLKEQPGGDVQVMGSLSVARFVIGAGLVDELRLMIEPVTLGGGKRVFPDDGVARPFELVSATTAATGVLVCVYRARS
jgi:dihydrofolate reductase